MHVKRRQQCGMNVGNMPTWTRQWKGKVGEASGTSDRSEWKSGQVRVSVSTVDSEGSSNSKLPWLTSATQFIGKRVHTASVCVVQTREDQHPNHQRLFEITVTLHECVLHYFSFSTTVLSVVGVHSCCIMFTFKLISTCFYILLFSGIKSGIYKLVWMKGNFVIILFCQFWQ